MFEVVLFDLGGVVCRFRPERRLELLAGACGLTPVEVRARLWDSGFDAACDRGEYTAEEMEREIRARLGLRMEMPALCQVWVSAFELDAAVLRLIASLRSRYRMALLTDNGPLLRDALPAAFPEVAAMLDPLLFSCDLGATKPGPAIFHRAVARLGVPPERALHVDDSPAAVEGARAAGLQAVRFTDAATLERDLALLLGAG